MDPSTKYGEIFPQNITIEDVRLAIEGKIDFELELIFKGRSEFREMIFDDFLVIDYLIQKNDSFPDPEDAPDPQYSFLPIHF